MRGRAFADALKHATVKAARHALDKTRGEHLYSFALFTSGEDDFGYVCASANTEEALVRATQANPKASPRDLRFSAPDWELHAFDEAVDAISLPPRGSRARDTSVYKAFLAALKAVDDSAVFGTGKRRHAVTLAVLCGDMSERFLLKGMRALNPPVVVTTYLERWTPKVFLDRQRALPARERTASLVRLWTDLSLDLDSPPARDARLAGVGPYDIEDLIRREGKASVDHLLTLIETHAQAAAWNKRGTPAFVKHGAISLPIALASFAAFLLCDLKPHVPSSAIPRLQESLRRRLTMDERMKNPVPTLAENIARVMHQLWPRRFPATVMNDVTNRLENPRPFLT